MNIVAEILNRPNFRFGLDKSERSRILEWGARVNQRFIQTLNQHKGIIEIEVSGKIPEFHEKQKTEYERFIDLMKPRWFGDRRKNILSAISLVVKWDTEIRQNELMTNHVHGNWMSHRFKVFADLDYLLSTFNISQFELYSLNQTRKLIEQTLNPVQNMSNLPDDFVLQIKNLLTSLARVINIIILSQYAFQYSQTIDKVIF